MTSKSKQAEYARKHYLKNREIMLERSKQWVEDNRDHANEYQRVYAKNNKEKVAARCSKWKSNNKDRMSSYRAKHKSKKLQAIPKWFDAKEVGYIYQLAKERDLQVDHIVPLDSKLVCGLHVQDNLRCIPAALNKSKGNRYWADMPHSK